MGKSRDLFKEIGDLKVTFHAKMGVIKDKNGRDLTEENRIKKRWQEYTDNLYRKDLNSTDYLNSWSNEMGPEILESEVRWALGCLSDNKAAGVDKIPIELFTILQDDAMRILLALCQQIWKTQQWPKNWKRSVYIPIPKKGNAKECFNYRTIALISHANKVMLKILQARLKQYMDQELPDVQAGFCRGRGTRDQIANVRWIKDKAREFQKNIYLCCIDYSKAFDCVDHNNMWQVLKEMGVQDYLIRLLRNLYVDQETTVRTEHGTREWFKIGKGV
ncbi:Hypothetical predicted protein [Pelobates cultripes]|uniref:Reverse transcriptase domain-containing protein n=1 Tax=Pelobates cultripes TaxID=61616 RepID=A0AAD1TCS0_PELCU|nr:Hypothetical predicted protein [Pelobates cultripes]